MSAKETPKRPEDSGAAEPKVGFDELLQRLENVVSELERGELPLERALHLFEEGVELSKQGGVRLEQAQARVDQLLGDPSASRVIRRTDLEPARSRQDKT